MAPLSRPIRSLVPAVLAISLLAFAVAAPAQVEGPLPALTFDRIDSNGAVWRLEDYVVTADGAAPSTPSPVYLQFGFMGCEPCEALARIADEELGDGVVRLYVHLDDVLLDSYDGSIRALWTELWGVSRQAPFDRFVVARRGTSDLMRQLCGPAANAPSGLLIREDGRVFRVIGNGTEEEYRTVFREFVSAVAQNP